LNAVLSVWLAARPGRRRGSQLATDPGNLLLRARALT
jgi:hypothetical protein